MTERIEMAKPGTTPIDSRLDGKVVVVTGASRGIGRALAEGFAQAGARVCCSSRSESKIASLASRLNAAGMQAMHVACDVSDLWSVEGLFSATKERFGGIDIVIVNAGHQADDAAVEDGDPGQWKTIVETNLIGAYYTMRTAVPYLREKGAGKIIAIGSGAGHHGVPRSSAYSCAKAGLHMLVKVLAAEVADANISVNEISPGPVDTDMVRSGAGAANVSLLTRVEWFKQPQDVVPLALFLATQPDHGPTAQTYSLLRR